MTDRVTPPVSTKPDNSVRILDTIIGIGAMLILLPVLPIIFLIWLHDRLRNAESEEND